MHNIFSDDSISKIIINKHVYIIHNYILKKMDIFNVLFDANSNGKTLEIEWPISIENVNKLLLCIYENNFSSFKENKSLPHCIEIISFMKYVGINEECVIKVCEFMTPDIFGDFIMECNKIEYDPDSINHIKSYQKT
jgi:hypothetical protein